jgi:V8-like Glu-specific endopeptidase
MMKIIFAALVLGSTSAFAMPVAPTRSIEAFGFKLSAPSKYDFEGIVKLSNCSGALIKFENMAETKKAMVLTNGHCADLPGGAFIEPNEIIFNRPVKRNMGIFDRNMKTHKVTTTKFLFATMTFTDISLYELELTYKQIKDQFDIEPYTVVSTHPAVNLETEIISGYWEKGYSCTVDAFIPTLKEDVYVWADSLRYAPGCDTIHGTSGSPIIERNTRNVVGINNTGSDNGERCTMDNPCEVSADGTITARKGISYGQQTYIMYSCMNADYTFDLNKSGCKLPKKIAR